MKYFQVNVATDVVKVVVNQHKLMILDRSKLAAVVRSHDLKYFSPTKKAFHFHSVPIFTNKLVGRCYLKS